MKFKAQRLIAIIVGILAAFAAHAQGKLLSVTGSRADSGYMLHVSGEGLAKPRIVLINSGTTALITFNAVWSSTTTTVKVRMNGIDFYRIGQFKDNPPQARIAVYFEKGFGVVCSESQSGWNLHITRKGIPNELADETASADAIAMAKAMKELSGAVSPVKTNETPKAKATTDTDSKGTATAVKDLSAVNLKTDPKTDEQPKRVSESAEADAKAMAQAIRNMSSEVSLVSTTKSSTETAIKPLKVKDQNPAAAPPAIKPPEPKSPTAGFGTAQSRVNIEFFDTELSIILKALSEQTGSNIVSSPEVKASLTVSLKNISVEQALDLVTKLSGYRFAKLDNTYVVGTSSFLQKVLSQEATTMATMTTTRVVPLASRKAGEIKRTILKALSIDQLNESLRVVHPAEKSDLTDVPVSAADATKAAEGGAAAQASTAIEGDADYLILVGDKGRVEQAATMIIQIDQALADMLGVAPTNGEGLRPITMTYVVRGGKATDLAEAIKNYQGGVIVSATPKDNRSLQTVVLHGRPAEVERLYNILAQIDDVSGLGQIVYTVYQVKFADPRALRDRVKATFDTLQVLTGAEAAAGLSYAEIGGAAATQAATTADGGKTTEGVSALNAKSIYTPREFAAVPMQLIISGPENTVNAALEFLNEIDLALPQIAIEARIVDATKEEILKAGISWDIFTGGAVNSIVLDNSQPPGSDGSPFNVTNVRLSGRGWGGTVIGSLDRALNKANFISKPNIIAHDGREAVVFVGDIVRYIKSIQVTPTGTNVEVGEEEVGVKLNVLPRVGSDGSITLEVQPVVSFIRSFLETGTGGMIPITAIRTARSTMRIANGETIAIGGLITEEIRKEVSGLPILMDLPIIGNLFKRTTNTKRQGEIIIFLSARVIQGDSLSAARGTGQPETNGNRKGG